MGVLDGKVAVITGAGGGIGRSHALLFAKEGAKIVVNDLGGVRDGTGEGGSSMADGVVQEIKDAGGEAVANCDSVATIEGGKAIVQSALDAFGKLDILVNNAGILRDKTLLKMDEELFDTVIQVHLKGTFCCTQAAGRVLREQGTGGRVINTTSVAGLMGNFGQTNYSSAKAGIAGFTRTCALEFQKMKVTVNAIAPIAKTRMTDDLPMFAGVGDDMIGPQFISPVALYLASDLAENVTGKIIGVQGRKIFAFVMTMTDGIIKDEGEWSIQEINDRIKDILGS